MGSFRLALLVLAGAFPAAGQITPTIYADFELRQHGNPDPIYFTIRLDRPNAPHAVVNFLGLVTGLRSWVEPSTGRPSSEPFYHGLQIYEVDANNRVCFGSPTNDGLGGPGYVVQDESPVSSGGLYHVYMDNDGPNTNGSRFFVSIPTQPLDGKYTRLGYVDSDNPGPGRNSRVTINWLSEVATDTDGKPVNAVTIEDIQIRGWAPDDGTLPLDTWNLPVVGASELRIERNGPSYRLLWSDEPGSAAYYFGSPDLVNWFPFEGFDPPGAASLGVDITDDIASGSQGFYRGSAIYYPEWPAADFDTTNTTLQFSYLTDSPLQNNLLRFHFGTGGSGFWEKFVQPFGSTEFLPDGSDTLIATWNATKPFAGELSTSPTGELPPYRFRLFFDYHYPVPALPVHRFEAFLTAPPFGGFSGSWTRTPLAP